MRIITRIAQFKKDYKKAIKSHKDVKKLREVITLLVNDEKLPIKYRDHKLTGVYGKARECHIEPDWLLIYEINLIPNPIFKYTYYLFLWQTCLSKKMSNI